MSLDLKKSRHYPSATRTADAKVLWQEQLFLNSERIPTEDALSDLTSHLSQG